MILAVAVGHFQSLFLFCWGLNVCTNESCRSQRQCLWPAMRLSTSPGEAMTAHVCMTCKRPIKAFFIYLYKRTVCMIINLSNKNIPYLVKVRNQAVSCVLLKMLNCTVSKLFLWSKHWNSTTCAHTFTVTAADRRSVLQGCGCQVCIMVLDTSPNSGLALGYRSKRCQIVLKCCWPKYGTSCGQGSLVCGKESKGDLHAGLHWHKFTSTMIRGRVKMLSKLMQV